MGATQSGCVINYENTWVHSTPCAPLPAQAVVGGHDCDGAPIYVGRAYHEGDQLPAKVVPSKGCAYICWGGEEHVKQHYEVLVGQSYAWVRYTGNVPPTAVRSGATRSGEPLYVGRGHHANSLTVGKIHPSHGCLYIPFGGQEVRVTHNYEVLIYEHREHWVTASPNYIPQGAVVAGNDTDSAPIYVGRAMHEAYNWLPSSVHSSIPSHAVVGGNDVDGSVMYVGRADHNGDMLVAKVIPSKRAAFVSWRGQEIAKECFEILCSQSLVWRHCHNHVIPENAVDCGSTKLGQRVYIGRGQFESSLTVGRISSVHRALFIPFGGMERRLESYEILVEGKRDAGWLIPDDIKSCPLNEVKPPVYSPMPQPSYCETASRSPPPPYASAPPTLTERPHHTKHERPHDIWVNASASYTPPNAVHGGHDSDMSSLLVCRAFHNGDIIPGKAVPSRRCAYVSFAGQEVPMSNYEVLVGDNYHWIPMYDNILPPGAVEAGRTASGEPLYVGRAHYCGSLTPGKVQRSHQCLYIAFGGYERRINKYEILVRRGDYHRDLCRMHY